MAGFDIQNIKFLVVDDDANMRQLLRTILSSLGVKDIETVSGADPGFAMLGNFQADIAICDLVMQPLDGIEFTRMVRNNADSPNCYLPIIMLTGHAEITAVQKARDAGIHEFMSKPVSPEKLYSKIHNIIETPRVFVRSSDYFGPDRRRRQDPKFKGPERRRNA
ncbi:MAG: response regulator [Alphaproteobacteria bacterium]|nr:response regulator [Alphaproteobacteria bacterium]